MKLNIKFIIMKRIILSIFILLLSFQMAQGQVIEPQPEKTPQDLHDMYIKKQRTNEIAGWICLGSGVGMMIGGLSTAMNHLFSDGNEGSGLILAGIGFSLVSVPLFISAGSNKRKARMSLQGSTVSVINLNFEKTKYMSVAVKIYF